MVVWYDEFPATTLHFSYLVKVELLDKGDFSERGLTAPLLLSTLSLMYQGHVTFFPFF